MPELPEVETVRRSLEERILGKAIARVQVMMAKMVRPGAEEFAHGLVCHAIEKLDRRGKYLLIHLTGDKALVVHLRMTGRLIYCHPDRPLDKHTHVILTLDDGHHLRYVDIRQFGKLQLIDKEDLSSLSGLATLGPEPLGEDFTKEGFKKALRNKRTKIKSLLLDQTFIAGLGNIYVDEALFRAKIHPERVGSTLNPREAVRLYTAVRDVIAEGIENRGTTFRDYVDGTGQAGSYQHQLRAYGRESQPCFYCGRPLERKVVAGRSSTFCPRCQKA